MARPPDWEARALAWFRSLEGEAPGAVIRAVGGPEDTRAQAFARLMVECRDKTQAEIDAHAFETVEELAAGVPNLPNPGDPYYFYGQRADMGELLRTR